MPRENFRIRVQRAAVKSMARSCGMEGTDGKTCAGKAAGYAYQMAVNKNETEASINIYGDICEWAWESLGEMDAVLLSKKLEELPESVAKINVHLNSYGGSVKEGIAIYNILRSHDAEIVTYCDGMACSIASVIFMAGDKRIMSHASELMVHNAWAMSLGNATELRKAADDLDKANDMSVAAYLSRVSISEPKLRELMDAESWLSAEEAVKYGFATEVVDYSEQDDEPEDEPEEEPTTVDDTAEEEPEVEPNDEPDDEGEEIDEQERLARNKWSAIARALEAAR